MIRLAGRFEFGDKVIDRPALSLPSQHFLQLNYTSKLPRSGRIDPRARSTTTPTCPAASYPCHPGQRRQSPIAPAHAWGDRATLDECGGYTLREVILCCYRVFQAEMQE